MSIASLTKFTVPLGTTASEGLLMPKLKYRFRVGFQGFGSLGATEATQLTKQVVSVARPNVNFNPQKIDVYNSTINFAGKPTWQTITLKLRDDITGTVSKIVGDQMQKQFDFLEQSAKAAASDYKFKLIIEMLDGGNTASGVANVLEKWECYGCFITQANYNGLSYSEQTQVEIDLTIQPDNCIQTQNTATPTGNQQAAGGAYPV
jgi:hypothetical protein